VRNICGRPEPGRTEPLTETARLAGDDPQIRRVVGSSSNPHVPVRSVSPLALARCFWRAEPSRAVTKIDGLSVSACPAQLPDPLETAAGDPLAFTELTRLLRQHELAPSSRPF
jgi:hypothetical protein